MRAMSAPRQSALPENSALLAKAGAKGNEKVALTELEAGYKPSPETRHQARVVRAGAEYELAKERCDDRAGNAKDVCVQEAKSAETAAKADAEAGMKTAEANATANEKSADARKDATEDKLGARYKAAKERCDTYAGNAKAVCVQQAKVKFGQ